MRIHLPRNIRDKLRSTLKQMGPLEIGGILMGEHIGKDAFRIVDITIQKHSGSFTNFVRKVAEAIMALFSFFKRTGNQFVRFNYLGEWHSHPSYSLCPSSKDIQSMVDIVTDEKVGANFAVLMIVHLTDNATLEASATVFFPDRTSGRCEIIMEEEP